MPSTVTFVGPGNSDPGQALADLLHAWEPTEEGMTYAGARQITRIRTRTQLGKDVNGAEFQSYSPKYAKTRTRKGRNAAPVDLTMTGRGLNSMRVEIRSENSFAITFADPDAAVYMEAISEGLGHEPARRFFDTSQQELDEVRDDLVGFNR